jgi:hypothetical protein
MRKFEENIFFAPVSSGVLYINFEKSVINGISIKNLDAELTKYCKSNDDRIKLWGIRDAKKTTYNKTIVGDFILFYREGYIIGYSKVHSLFENEDLSIAIWGIFENKQRGEKYSWSNIIVLEDYNTCNIPFSKFRELGEYNEGFSVRGYLEFREKAVKKINNEFLGIQAFINSHSK